MSQPICTICGEGGAGVEFRIFDPVIPPFGTACVACEDKITEGEADNAS